MGILRNRDDRGSTVRCPACGSGDVGLGYVDRVFSIVAHNCVACGHHWTDALIDLATAELRSRARTHAGL